MIEMLSRHTDIVNKLTEKVPALIPVLFDGLICYSRLTQDGFRRASLCSSTRLVGGGDVCLHPWQDFPLLHLHDLHHQPVYLGVLYVFELDLQQRLIFGLRCIILVQG